MHIGQAVKKLVEKSRITNKELSDRIGTSENNLYKIYNREHLGTDLLEKISTVLGVDIQSFFYPEATADELGSHKQSQKGGIGNVQVIGTYQECMSELVSVQKELLAEKDRNIQLQREINDMLRKQLKDE